MTILAAFDAAVAAHPDRPAIIDGKGRVVSFASLHARAGFLADAWAKRGIGPGDRVLIAVSVTPDLYAALAALWRLGAVAVLPEPAMGLKGVKTALAAAEVTAWIGAGVLRVLPLLVPRLLGATRLSLGAGAASDLPSPDWPDDHPALMSFTSGSTGRAKAIMRSHGFLKAQNRAVGPLLASDQTEIDLVAFPVFVLANLGSGVTSVLPNWPLRRPDRADPKAIRAHIAKHGVTRLLLPPVLAEALANAPLPASVTTIFTGGGPVFPDVVERLTAHNPALRVMAVYGSTEAEPIAELEVSALTPADRARIDGGEGLLAGPPVDAVRVRIVEDEILVAGDHVVETYVDPADNAVTKTRDEKGTIWHRTGDGGRFDEAGRLWLLGRTQGRIEGLWPFAIEVAARSWPGVRRAALCPLDGKACLAIEGDTAHLAHWREAAAALGVATVVALKSIPLDRRHRSKVDYARLAELVRASAA
ncbi:AMP-binding protein [uncultured Erythrobacter sp.]|uniref:AMP-binding protein n=1 Tax=uncultured Erythrobacter sp. TaxID=263913 RepID=UPI0026583146|nr:AMP-binding protein [uncultured Erythrobacter sp.]